MRRFNTAGPCDPELHYMLPPLRRLPQVGRLIDGRSYFVIHAPRQVGKTTSLLTLARTLTREGRYVAVLVSMATGSVQGEDIDAAEPAILDDWRDSAGWQLPPELQPPPWPVAPPGRRIGAALSAWAQAAPLPLVVFLDEIDSLENRVLLSVLRQLHSGCVRRPQAFPWSMALIGLRDVRDYKVTDQDRNRLGTASPFNIKERSLTLRNFTQEEVAELYGQHTADSGQVFEPEAIQRVFELTQGQPWLVNALAQEMVEVLVPDPADPVRLEHVDRAKDILIRRRDTHFDSLAERLREDRVRKVIEPILVGDVLEDMPEDDLQFSIDLGLVTRTPQSGLAIANPIYAEVIPRSLTRGIEDSLGMIRPTWLTPEGRLDPDRLLRAFLEFWRLHGEALLKSAPYHEAAPQLVMMAFLHRVVNGGRLQREFAIGSGRLDLLLEHGDARVPIELKVWKPGDPDPLTRGLEQLDEYLAGLGLSSGWLVIFERRPGQKRLSERTSFEQRTTPGGRSVVVIRG